VIRGPDHISNTPKQIQVLQAIGAELPVYAHVPNVNGPDGSKLSKRHGAVSVDDFREDGYLPEALMNFLALLGWAPDGETTLMTRDELVERFTLERVGSSPAIFDYAKLDWMNGVYLRSLAPAEFADRLAAYLGERGYDWPEERVRAAAAVVQEKIGRLGEFPGFAGFLFGEVEPDPALLDERILRAAEVALAGLEAWTAEAIEAGLKSLCEELGEKPRTVYLPIRVAVTGSRVSPGLYESLELLGREESLARLSAGAARVAGAV
jgi:glutamyl-tRNA synthetase